MGVRAVCSKQWRWTHVNFSAWQVRMKYFIAAYLCSRIVALTNYATLNDWPSALTASHFVWTPVCCVSALAPLHHAFAHLFICLSFC